VHVLIGLVAINMCFLVWGYALFAALRRRASLADCGLAYCAGVGALSTVASVLAVAGHLPGVILTAGMTGILAVLLALAPIRWRSDRLRRFATTEGLAAALIGLACVAYSVVLLRTAYVMRLNEWDAWAIWTVKAKGLVTLGHLGTADFVGAWPAYPPLVPVMQSLVFRFIGTVDTQVVHTEYALLLIAFAGALWRLLSQRSSALVGAVGALTLLTLPGLQEDGIAAQADLPVAIFIALAGFFVVTWIADRRGDALACFAVFGAFAVWTKNEGAMLVLALGIAGLLASIGRDRKSVLQLIAATAAALAARLPWQIWTHIHHAHADTPLSPGLHVGYLRARLSTAQLVADEFWHRLSNVHAWFAAPYLLGALSIALIVKGQRRVVVFAVCAPLIAFILLVWAYMIRNDPLGIQWLLNTSASRTTASIGLLATTLVFVEMTSLLRERRRSVRTSSPGASNSRVPSGEAPFSGPAGV
jgi:hypothetical protein